MGGNEVAHVIASFDKCGAAENFKYVAEVDRVYLYSGCNFP